MAFLHCPTGNIQNVFHTKLAKDNFDGVRKRVKLNFMRHPPCCEQAPGAYRTKEGWRDRNIVKTKTSSLNGYKTLREHKQNIRAQ
eukprot:5027271-Amphidinium_carterae.1